jgi:hypothetical protein
LCLISSTAISMLVKVYTIIRISDCASFNCSKITSLQPPRGEKKALMVDKVEFPPGARHNSDGSVVFPMRGKAPTCNVPGYVEDPTDPYRWLMVYTLCDNREINKLMPCPRSGRPVCRDYCAKVNMVVTPRYCNIDCNIPAEERIKSTESPEK